MENDTLFRSKIIASGSAFPSKQLTNADLEKMLDTNDAWITERTGIKTRNIVDPMKNETNSSLGFEASKKALERAGISASEIDMIIYATCTPDQLVPFTASILQNKLGANNAASMDVNAACSGFVYSLSIADAYIRSGIYKKILVVGADILSSITDWTDRSSCILFGDAAGAFILERCQVPQSSQNNSTKSSQIYSAHLYTDGSYKDLLELPAGGSANPATHDTVERREHFLRMKGTEVFKIAVRLMADTASEALQKNGFSIDEVDWVVPHQANQRIIDAVAKRLKIPKEKVINNIRHCGNTSSATVPTAVDQAIQEGKIKQGDLVLFTVFGAGFSYGSVLIRW